MGLGGGDDDRCMSQLGVHHEQALRDRSAKFENEAEPKRSVEHDHTVRDYERDEMCRLCTVRQRERISRWCKCVCMMRGRSVVALAVTCVACASV